MDTYIILIQDGQLAHTHLDILGRTRDSSFNFVTQVK
jgi:hypothetical protein